MSEGTANRPPMRRGPHGPGPRAAEKPKNFKKAVKIAGQMILKPKLNAGVDAYSIFIFLLIRFHGL